MESATPGVKSTSDGWLNRYLQSKQDHGAVVVSRRVDDEDDAARASGKRARGCDGEPVRVSRFARASRRRICRAALKQFTQQKSNDALADNGRETFEAVNYLKKANPAQYKPENGAQYPRNPFGNSLLADRTAHQSRRRIGSCFY